MPVPEKITIYLNDGTTEEHTEFFALISQLGGTAVRGSIRPERLVIALASFLNENPEFIEAIMVILGARKVRLPVGQLEGGPAGNC